MTRDAIQARRHIAPVVALTACFAIMTALTQPFGDFPLNDDWAYAIPVKHIIRGDGLRFTNWQSMPLLVHVLLGALTSSITGFSFTTLRLTTLTAALVATISLYGLLVVCRAPRSYAFVAALCLLANPIFLALAHTFMTDVPFLGLALASCALLLWAEQRSSRPLLLAGLLLAILALFIRQLALFIPLAFLVQRCARRSQSWKQLSRLALPLGLSALLLLGYEALLEHTGNLPSHYRDKTAALADALQALSHLRVGVLAQLALRALLSALYCGLLFLPLTAAYAANQWRSQRRRMLRRWLAGAALALVTTLVLVRSGRALPYLGNVLQADGVGPRTLAGAAHRPAPWIFELLWPGLTFLACLAALQLCACAWTGLRRAWWWARAPQRARRSSATSLFTLVLLGCTFVPLGLAFAPLFDRYVLWFAPFVLMLAMRRQFALWRRWERQGLAIGCSLAIVSGAVSVSLVHDYLAWNRTRWAALHYLQRGIGVPPAGIDGGFEYNQFEAHTEPQLPEDYVDPHGGDAAYHSRRYAVAFEPRTTDQVLGAFSWHAWMPVSPHQIVAVRRMQ